MESEKRPLTPDGTFSNGVFNIFTVSLNSNKKIFENNLGKWKK